ncbi:uncharacterized protein AMSG_03659 [Thecamonas trahens ATCC 50062]|uniref:Uncharacterized protein n=1 Tax=Thecamonas trahens ATCC 50062 TaxID=461836 RepID=A0A0L0D586_THETB|nr:hypothetical protein AMSG_03659 [Thecamonas trahens ATCC 50062]KNC47231.1 hypothetical protein AMSG_03659 [Thecamonas trahens ATCC 50062]|eukprot:XP_013759574.1 hypothetical protein AMSG_03659 [Thecamonas trahens ATCC 50062]
MPSPLAPSASELSSPASSSWDPSASLLWSGDSSEASGPWAVPDETSLAADGTEVPADAHDTTVELKAQIAALTAELDAYRNHNADMALLEETVSSIEDRMAGETSMVELWRTRYLEAAARADAAEAEVARLTALLEAPTRMGCEGEKNVGEDVMELEVEAKPSPTARDALATPASPATPSHPALRNHGPSTILPRTPLHLRPWEM